MQQIIAIMMSNVHSMILCKSEGHSPVLCLIHLSGLCCVCISVMFVGEGVQLRGQSDKHEFCALPDSRLRLICLSLGRPRTSMEYQICEHRCVLGGLNHLESCRWKLFGKW